MASYQNFIATISNALTFNLKSEDGRYVRLNPRTLTINGVLQNRQLLHLDNTPGQQPATLILKDFPNTDNFNLFIETSAAESILEFPINIITDEVTGAQFIQVDINSTGKPLRIDPDVSPGVVVQFAEFRVFGEEPTPTIVVDAFGFLRVGGGVSVPKFGFEAILPNININTVVNWRPILPFILNGGSLVGQVQQVEGGLAAAIIGGIVGGVLTIYALPIAFGSIILLMVFINRLIYSTRPPVRLPRLPIRFTHIDETTANNINQLQNLPIERITQYAIDIARLNNIDLSEVHQIAWYIQNSGSTALGSILQTLKPA